MNRSALSAALACVLLPAAPAAQAQSAPIALSEQEQAAAFTAGEFERLGAQWQGCGAGSAGYTPGKIAEARDIDGDGRPDAVITEASKDCYGDDGAGFTLVSKQADGSWKLIRRGGPGVPHFLPRDAAAGPNIVGWPDLEIGTPGSCFQIERWNGSEYKPNRREYQGKAC